MVSTQIFRDIRDEPSYRARYIYTGRGKVWDECLGEKKYGIRVCKNSAKLRDDEYWKFWSIPYKKKL